MNRTRRIIALAGLIVLPALLGACATIDGVGQDLSTTARTVESWF